MRWVGSSRSPRRVPSIHYRPTASGGYDLPIRLEALPSRAARPLSSATSSPSASSACPRAEVARRLVTMDKVVATTAEAVADVTDGSSLAVGGFGLCGIPQALIAAVLDLGVRDLETVSNNLGVDGIGLGLLLEHKRIRRTINSYVGENKEFAHQYISGELELELTPQGTLAERLRAGGAGIPAFYTPTGVGTQVADGGLAWRYHADGTVAVASPPKETREFDGVAYVLERAIRTDFALVHAFKGDRHGNLVYHAAAANFNPDCAVAGRITIAQVEHLVEPGEIDPAQVHTPGIYVHRVVHVPNPVKPVEKETVRSEATRSGAK